MSTIEYGSMANSKSPILKAFNDHFTEFVDDIQTVFPNDPDILTAKNSLAMIRKANPRLLIQVWMTSIVGKYQAVIEAGDLSYFIQKDYTQDLAVTENQNTIMEGIERLRKPIATMSNENQEKVMKYLQNLCQLAILYHSS